MSRASKLLNVALLAVLTATIAVTVVFTVKPDRRPNHASVSMLERGTPPTPQIEPLELPEYAIEPATLDELLWLPADQLGEVDIARMNLLAATALAGTEDLDIDHALATLDEWAERVHFETERHLYRVNDPRFADRYGGSEAHFRAEMLAQVLQEDLGVQYDMTAVDNFSFADPSVAFIHGMIPGPGGTMADTPGGTCVSMPVLYVAVGRRLGYPLKLSTTNSHIFARWDGLEHENPRWRERFNCETTNGFHRFDDDYYRNWPKPVTDRQVAVNGYLQSLTPAKEMAQFMAARGHHGVDVGQFGFAARCYENAYRYDNTRPAYRAWFVDAAVRSGYRAATPSLARAIQQHPHRPRPHPDVPDPTAGLGLPTATYDPPEVLRTARVGSWQNSRSPQVQRDQHTFPTGFEPQQPNRGNTSRPSIPTPHYLPDHSPDWGSP